MRPAQFSAAAGESGVSMTAACYQFAMYTDHVHLTNAATRDMGILLGHALYDALHGGHPLLAPSRVQVQGSEATLTFATAMALDAAGAVSSHDATRIARNAGFFAYASDGRALSVAAVLSEDGCTLSLHADGDIARLTYGYDPDAKENEGYTYGGALRRAKTVPGYTAPLGEYMPVQPIYGTI